MTWSAVRKAAGVVALSVATFSASQVLAESYFYMGHDIRIALLVDKDSIKVDGDKRTATVLELKMFPVKMAPGSPDYYWFERLNEFNCADNTSRTMSVLARTKDRKKVHTNPDAKFGEWMAPEPNSILSVMQKFVCSNDTGKPVRPEPDLTKFERLYHGSLKRIG